MHYPGRFTPRSTRSRSSDRSIEHVAASTGDGYIVVDVWESQELLDQFAQTLYRSEGFVEVGRRARYYQPDDVDAIVMKLDLGGWVARPDAGNALRETPQISSPPGADSSDPVGVAPKLRSSAQHSAADAGACT